VPAAVLARPLGDALHEEPGIDRDERRGTQAAEGEDRRAERRGGGGRTPGEGAERPAGARAPPDPGARCRQDEDERGADPREHAAPAEVGMAPRDRKAGLEEV